MTYPRSVKQMLINTSAPQPATIKTPTGGTAGLFVSNVFSLGEKTALG